MIVYLLWHSYPDEPDDDNAKLLGVYSTPGAFGIGGALVRSSCSDASEGVKEYGEKDAGTWDAEVARSRGCR